MHVPSFLYLHWHPDPEIFKVAGIGIRYYSLCFLSGISLSYIILRKDFIKKGIDLILLDRLLLYIVAGTIIGARLGHCLFYEPGYYLRHLQEIVLPWSGTPGQEGFHFTGYQGLASHGAALGILLSSWLFARRYRLPYLLILDLLAPFIPLAGAAIRLGNLFNSEIIGRPVHVQWAIVFDHIDQLPRHPAQIYETATYLAIFAILRYLSVKTMMERKEGMLLGLLLVLLFSARFMLEFFKEDQVGFESQLWLNMGQLMSLPFIILGIILMRRRYAH